ncbi:MAG: ABC transporter permease [Myxococcota bacterium]
MMSLLTLAFRNALRNGRRTLLTAATVTIGTAFTVVTLSFLSGIMDTMARDWTDAFGPIRVITDAYAEQERLQPLHENLAEVEPLLETTRQIDGVARAVPMIRTGVLAAVGEELGEDPALLVGSSPEYYEHHVLARSTLNGGRWLAEGAEDEEVVLGARVARDIGAQVGDEILLMGTTQYGSMSPISADVVGIITGNSTIDAQAYVTLETIRWIVDLPDGALEILVFPEENADSQIAALTQTIDAAVGEGYTVSPWFARDVWLTGKPVMDAMELGLGVAVIFVMALAIFNTMTMSVLERTNEIGVMRAMGQTRAGAVGSFLIESLAIGLLGGIAGAAVGAVPALYLENNGMTYAQDLVDEMDASMPIASTLYGDFNMEIVLTAVTIGVITAAIGALLPAIRAARIQPYEAMRAKR